MWRNGGSDSGLITEINFRKFAKSARVEIHGCAEVDAKTLNDSFATNFSARLGAGSFVIAHSNEENPNRFKPTGNLKVDIEKQDYRHDLRIVYSNGKVAGWTFKEGYLNDKDLEIIKKQGYLDQDDLRKLKEKKNLGTGALNALSGLAKRGGS